MPSKATFDALFARGFSSKLAAGLAKKHTLNKLKTLSLEKLRQLGVSDELAAELHKETRPPIEPDTVFKLLYESRRTCCVCRDRANPIILHHIKPWHDSRDHGEDNLVVLCLNCHGEAHTRRELSLNLTQDQLRDHKKRWVEQVRIDTLSSRTQPNAGPLSMPVWDYLNHRRIHDAATDCNFAMSDGVRYRELVDEGVITPSGDLRLPPPRQLREYDFLYQVIDRGARAFYQSLLMKVIVSFPVVDLSESWNQSTVNILEDGCVVMYAGGVRFQKHKGCPESGTGQLRTAYVQKRGIRLTFEFDAWETTSVSSRGNLAGNWPCTVVCRVRSVKTESKVKIIRASGLAIGTGYSIPIRGTIFDGIPIDSDEGDVS